MLQTEAGRLRLFGWLATLAAVLQAIGLIRYINRLPDDWGDCDLRHQPDCLCAG